MLQSWEVVPLSYVGETISDNSAITWLNDKLSLEFVDSGNDYVSVNLFVSL